MAWLTAALLAGCVGDGPRTIAEESPPFGHPDSVLFWTPEQQLAGFPRYDELFDARVLPASSDPLPLPAAPRNTEGLEYEIDGELFDLSGFVEHNHVQGVIVVQKGEVLLEEYRGEHHADRRWVSYSVAKSVVSLLIGAALADGYIDSVDDPVTLYVPMLRGGAYEGVRIRDVLQMSSGVQWNEDYTDPSADVSLEIGLPNAARLRRLSALPRVAEPGDRFNYSTGETHLAGAVLRGAIGNNLATYLHQKIWQPYGMEAEANWRLVEPRGAEHGGCCISATLRDYARLGMFALEHGTLRDGTSVLPNGWMIESTEPSEANPGYGYLWWLNEGGGFSAVGIFGQLIHIDPELDLVVATHSAWPSPVGSAFSAHRAGFLRGVKAWLGR